MVKILKRLSISAITYYQRLHSNMEHHSNTLISHRSTAYQCSSGEPIQTLETQMAQKNSRRISHLTCILLFLFKIITNDPNVKLYYHSFTYHTYRKKKNVYLKDYCVHIFF